MYVKRGRKPRPIRNESLAVQAARDWRLANEAIKESKLVKDRALVRMISAGMSVHQIAQACGVYPGSIRHQAEMAGINLPRTPPRKRRETMREVMKAPERSTSVLFGDFPNAKSS